MIYHLKPAFSKFEPMDAQYENDESWKDPATALQRVVLKFTLDAWPRGNEVIGNLAQLRDMNSQRFSDYISSPFWISLLREIRGSTNVPFSHPFLASYKTINDLPPEQKGNISLANAPALGGLVGALIRDEYSDVQTGESGNEEDNQEDGNDSTFTSQYAGRDGSRYQTDSAQPEPLAVESEDEREDIIHVQTPSPSYSNRSKKRKVQHMKEEFNREGSHYGQYDPPRRSLQRIVKLRIPGLFLAENPTVQGLETRTSPRKRQVTSGNASYAPAQEPSPTIAAPPRATSRSIDSFTPAEHQRVDHPQPSLEPRNPGEEIHMADAGGSAPEPVERTLPWQPVDLEIARRALEESQRSSISAARNSEELRRRHSSSAQPVHRSRKHNLSMANNAGTSRPATPASAPPPAPQTAPQPLYQAPAYSHTPVRASPAPPAPSPPVRTKIEQAIGVLQDEYGERLGLGDMLGSINLLKNDVEASVFLTLKPGTLRDAWLLDSIKSS
jgi:hypothetical protein